MHGLSFPLHLSHSSKCAIEKKFSKQSKMRKGKIFFEKILTVSSFPPYSQLALPALFVRQHGDEIEKYVTLRNVANREMWTVNINITYRHAQPHALFKGGWKAFTVANDLVIGDQLTFVLVAKFMFDVFIFREGGNPALCVRKPKMRPQDLSLSRRRSRLPQFGLQQGCEFSANCCEEPEIAFNRTLIAKDAAEKSYASEAPDSSQNLPDMDSHFFEPKNIGADSCYDSQSGRESAMDRIKLDVKSESDTTDGSAQQTVNRDYEPHASTRRRNSQLPPRFTKKLKATNLSSRRNEANRVRMTGILEIPTKFWKTYSTRLRPFVKLQGIREESPMRTVACSPHLQENRYWRLRLRAGWVDFANENNLELGQELQFTLAGDSFFIVRAVQS